MFEYIELFRNRKRRHSLRCLSPADFKPATVPKHARAMCAEKVASFFCHRSMSFPSCLDYAGWLSMIDQGTRVRITLVKKKPASASNARNSDSVRSRPVISTIMFRSMYLAGSG